MSGQARPRPPATAPRPAALPHAVLTVLVLVGGLLVTAFVSFLAAGPTGSVAFVVVLRTVLGVAAVVVTVRWRAGKAHAVGLPMPRQVGAPAALAYVLLPTTWGGGTFLGQALGALTGPSALAVAAAVVADAVVWGVAVVVGLRWAADAAARRPAPLTPYG